MCLCVSYTDYGRKLSTGEKLLFRVLEITPCFFSENPQFSLYIKYIKRNQPSSRIDPSINKMVPETFSDNCLHYEEFAKKTKKDQHQCFMQIT